MDTKKNSGYGNSGDGNSGYFNSGNFNSGNGNSGDWNSGKFNSGDWNSGDWNSGNGNSGDFNSGKFNSGDWNSGYWNSGYFNIDEPKVRIFGKETEIKREDLIFPNFCYFNLTEYIYESDMTEEQKNNPDFAYYKTTGGILIEYDYKEAFKKSYESLTKEEKEIQTKQLKALPNWNSDIFFDISGIRIDEEENIQEEIIELNGIKYKRI